MKSIARAASSVTAAMLLTLVVATAHADVPGRVGRISFMQGDVQAYSENEPEWKAAYINEPLTSRNSVFVGDSGRVEISIGSTTVAMDAGSQVDIQQLDDNTFNANVVRGHVSVQVRRLDPADAYNVAAPDASFALLRPGRYRIDALETSSGITVFAGQASVQGERSTTLVNAGDALRIAVDPSNPNQSPELQTASPAPLPLDNWVAEREARFRNSQTERYVSPNMTGYEDLDANGRWANEADVGPVWYPTTYVHQDWAPYRYGRWAYVAPWGYTWVDDAPWGFAPFHYGRWLEVGGRWGWCPGAYVARPVYAPALVGFYGGAGFSASFAVGAGPAVGWYPLAPWQRYAPHYTRNAVYINQVNNITVANPPRRFAGDNGGRDWNREHGATVAPQEAFASQRSISRVAMAAPRGLVERATAVNVADLPRPAAVAGAIRRGPNVGEGIPRPEFRSPREYATRTAPVAGPQRGVGAVVPQQDNPRGIERSPLPPNDRRLREEGRPEGRAENRVETRPGAFDAQRPQPAVPNQVPNAGLQAERVFPNQRGPNPPAFNREARPVLQPVVPTGDGQGGALAAPQRYAPRFQPPNQPPNQPGQIERGFERPNRENRNVQPQPPGTERQQIVERPQRFERPAPPPAVVAPQAPQAPVAPQPVQRPQPHLPPQPQALQQQPQPPRAEPGGQKGGPERGEPGPVPGSKRDR